jgi:hypothetical protein
VNAYRQNFSANDGDLKQISSDFQEILREWEDGPDGIMNASWRQRSHDVQRAVALSCHASTMIMAAVAHLTHVAVSLEDNLLSWVPKAT